MLYLVNQCPLQLAPLQQENGIFIESVIVMSVKNLFAFSEAKIKMFRIDAKREHLWIFVIVGKTKNIQNGKQHFSPICDSRGVRELNLMCIKIGTTKGHWKKFFTVIAHKSLDVYYVKCLSLFHLAMQRLRFIYA